MGQMYLQRFVYHEGVTKPALDEAWSEGFKAFARTGNWGDVDGGVTHHQTHGTGWGGYVLIAPVAPSTRFFTVSTESDLKTHTPRLPSELGATNGSSVPCGRSSWALQNASGSDTE